MSLQQAAGYNNAKKPFSLSLRGAEVTNQSYLFLLRLLRCARNDSENHAARCRELPYYIICNYSGCLVHGSGFTVGRFPLLIFLEIVDLPARALISTCLFNYTLNIHNNPFFPYISGLAWQAGETTNGSTPCQSPLTG